MSRPRNPQLDALRCYAFAMVFACHAFPTLGAGRFGVDLFFVLSGYLVTSLLEQERAETGTVATRVFWQRRFARIAPPYFLMLALMAPALNWRHLFGFTAFLGNFAMIGDSPPLAATHLWSLCVEAQFYFAWPLILQRFRNIPRLAFAMLAGALAGRLGVAGLGIPHDAVWFFTPTRIDGFAVGALLAVWRPALPASAIPVGAVGFLLAEWLLNGAGWPFAYTVAAISAGAVVCGAQALPAPRHAVRIGAISYGLYLVHLPLLMLAGSPLVALGASLLIAMASHRFIEAPAYALLLSVMRPRVPRAVSRLASAALPPREPETAGLAAGVAP